MGMNTSEKIKKGLECCHTADCDLCDCAQCPYAVKKSFTKTCDVEMGHDTLELIQQLEAHVPKWISVEERLPKGEALAVNDCGAMMVGWISYQTYGKESTYICDDPDSGIGICYVTHWMPLPEPPKE